MYLEKINLKVKIETFWVLISHFVMIKNLGCSSMLVYCIAALKTCVSGIKLWFSNPFLK